MSSPAEPIALVTTKPEADIAADLKAKLEAALAPVCDLFDEATRHGLMVQWDAIAPGPPFLRHAVRGLRLVKHY
jgi:hypothetical protein